MKIIDEKGRLFGKINVIDFLVILFFIFLVPMSYYTYKIVYQKPPKQETPKQETPKQEEPKKEFIEIEINCNLIKVSPEILLLIKVGDKSLDIKGDQIGEITWIGESRAYVYKFFSGPLIINPLIIKDKVLKELPVKLKLKAEIRDNNLYYNNQQISNISPLVFATDNYTVTAIPDEEKQWVQVKVTFQHLLLKLSDIIKNQDIERDNEDRVIGIIKEVISKKTSVANAVDTQKREFISANIPSRIDITVLLNLLCNKKGNTFYFKTYPLKIGNQITFTTDLYVASGEILDVDWKDAERNN